jgi:transcriptional regulator with XRE-family HTH domain
METVDLHAHANLPCVEANHPLRQRREELGLTQAEVSLRAQIPVPSLSRIETGKSGVSTATLIRLARVLGLHALASELSYWTGERP